MFTSFAGTKNGLSVRLGCLLTSSVRLSNIRLAPCYSHKLRLMPRYWVHKVQMCCHKYLFGCFACTLHFLMFLHWYSGFSCVQVAVTFTYTPVCTSACSIAQVLACTPKWCSIYGCARAVWVHRVVEFSVAPKVFSTSLCCNSWQRPEKFMSVSADKCRYYAVSAGECKHSAGTV